jgi:peptidoglycan/LPS O-acetylase OafA/YrhL
LTGAFRLILALIVVLSHLVGAPWVAHMGFYAVRAFFVLSGFVMTSALNEIYRHDGFRFWSNRLLRLLPPYYLVCFATALAVRFYPDQAAAFLPRWGFAMTSDAVAENLILAPLAFTDLKFRLIPPAWSVAVEIMMYCVLYVGMARSLRGALLCLSLGVAIHCVWLLTGVPFDERYFTPASALLSFSLGATLYFFRRDEASPADTKLGALALIAWFVNLLFQGALFANGYALHAGFYVNTILAALIVVFLSRVDPGPRVRRIDTALGQLSYPVFLCQWLGGFFAYMLWSETHARGWGFVLIALPIILLFSVAVALGHQILVEPLRARIRVGDRLRVGNP